ncbi:MAG: pentapeptide repeat-containing protein [Candidatus Aenigmarchaeota archaeon]|nr:pentapeptide repeat-containing protein [Candidatus Aenigmarchaeota archaeon]
MAQLFTISSRELMKKLMEGERDFSRRKLGGAPLGIDEIAQLNMYLKSADLSGEPVILDLADISGANAPEIYAPHTRARGARIVGARFPGAVLSYCDLSPFVHPNRTQTRTDLSYTRFDRAQMDNSDISGATLRGTRFMYTNLWDAKMEGVAGLEDALFLDSAIMRREQRATIDAYLRGR